MLEYEKELAKKSIKIGGYNEKNNNSRKLENE